MKAYQKWFRDVVGEHRCAAASSSGQEADLVVLTKQDWRGPKGWGPTGQGHWELVAVEATFDVTVHLPEKAAGVVHLKVGAKETAKRAEGRQAVFEDIALPAGNTRLEAWLGGEGEVRPIWFVEVKRK